MQIEEKKKEEGNWDEDLISGALSGVLTIINEITRSKKRLRKIEKEGTTLYFSYGKYHVVCLIANTDLPILIKKLDEFSKDFEKRFNKDLKNFVGDLRPFGPTKYMVKRKFSQKYT
jgi:hypothetical protein